VCRRRVVAAGKQWHGGKADVCRSSDEVHFDHTLYTHADGYAYCYPHRDASADTHPHLSTHGYANVDVNADSHAYPYLDDDAHPDPCAYPHAHPNIHVDACFHGHACGESFAYAQDKHCRTTDTYSCDTG